MRQMSVRIFSLRRLALLLPVLLLLGLTQTASAWEGGHGGGGRGGWGGEHGGGWRGGEGWRGGWRGGWGGGWGWGGWGPGWGGWGCCGYGGDLLLGVPPVVVAPPAYYAAPAYPAAPYYPPPPTEPSGDGYYPPLNQSMPPPQQQQAARSCLAGGYVCPLEAAVPPGGSCYCHGNDGGRINGRASR